MASMTAQITDDNDVTSVVIWRDGKIVSEGWASSELRTAAEIRNGEGVVYSPNPAFRTMRNHLRSPYSTVEIMLSLWGARNIEWIDIDDIEAPPDGDYIESNPRTP